LVIIWRPEYRVVPWALDLVGHDKHLLHDIDAKNTNPNTDPDLAFVLSNFVHSDNIKISKSNESGENAD